jgi:tRNA(fMet)-specific endonuclease VapC
MPLQYLLDTNICIYIAKQRPSKLAERFASLESGTVAMSLITFGELRFGAEKSVRRDETLAILERLTEQIPVLAPGPAVGETYGLLRATLEKSGTPIGNNDLWIAAHALSLDLTLVSNNLKEFARIPNLKLENWAE